MTLPSKTMSHQPTRPENKGPVAASGSNRIAPRGLKPRGRNRFFIFLCFGVILLAGLGAAWWFLPRVNPRHADLIWRTAQRETVQLTIVERGELESARNADIICRVKAGKQTRNTTIKWLIDAGTQVVPGQVVARLDDSALVNDLRDQEIVVQKANLDWETARDHYIFVKSQNESDLKTAEINLQLAKLELKKYQEGEYASLLKDVRSRILLAESDVEMWNERVAWSNRMVKKKFITPTQAEADRSRQRSAQVALDKVNEELRVLRDYTRLAMTTQLKGNIATATSELKRVQTQARSVESQALNDRDTKRAIYDKELSRYNEIQREIENCTLRAPQGGLVVYFESERSRRSAESEKIEVGATVHEGQKLMQIPDMNRMLVNTRVHEALVSHLKGEVRKPTGLRDALRSALLTAPSLTGRLISVTALPAVLDQTEGDYLRELETVKATDGQQAIIQVGTFPNRRIEGRVKTVATVATKEWFSDVRVYKTMIEIQGDVKGLKPGMSARVTIYTDRKAENVIAVPVQAVIREAGKEARHFVYVRNSAGVIEKREVVVGINNERMVEIKKGLNAGELIAENPQILDQPGKKAAKDKGQSSKPQSPGGRGRKR